jgi:hypothetical protein
MAQDYVQRRLLVSVVLKLQGLLPEMYLFYKFSKQI